MQLTPSSARALMLAAQGLLEPPRSPAAKPDVFAAIRRMGALQIDTIHVVARSPYFVLWSRLGDYDPVWLDELLAEGAIFEYWAHAACFLPAEDYGLFRRRMQEAPRDWRDPRGWLATHPELVERILGRIRQEGGLRSADFENPRAQPGGWWNWKEEKLALEYLFTAGVLMVARRQKFQRVYDLRERVRPGWDDANTPSLEAVYRELALKTVRSLGVAIPAWVPDYFRLPKRETAKILAGLAAENRLVEVEVEGWSGPAYIHPENRELAAAAADGLLQPTYTTLLSPFDPLVWDRSRAKFLFDFDFSLECYLPAEKRRYGYFSLPILHRGALAGRLDAKAHRQDGIFEVRSLTLEPGFVPGPEFAPDLRSALERCATWHRTPEIIIRQK